MKIQINKGDKYFEIYQREFYDPLRRMGLFMAAEDGEGTEIIEADFYDHVKKYFDEKI